MFSRKHEHKFHFGPVSHLSRIAAFAAASLIVFPLSGETIGNWPGTGDTVLQPNASPRKIVKILSRKPEFSIQLKGDADNKTDLQIEFSKPYRLTAGTRCRISVEMKANQEIELNMGIMSAKPPYKSIPKSWKICRLKTEYTVFTHEFITDKDYDQPFYTPLFVSKNFKAGTIITVRNVTFETIEGKN